MAITIAQTCDKCKKERTITDKRQREQGGWRVINDHDICETCMDEFLKTVSHV